jgi:hypothetical protein
MASFTSLITQISGKIPTKERKGYDAQVRAWVEASILKVSKLAKWDWRKQIYEFSITTSDHTYDMPPDCDMISADNGVLLDINGNPTKNVLVFMPENRFNEKYIRDQGDTETASTPEFFIALTQVSGIGSIKVRTYPISDTAYTGRLYYYTNPSTGDAAYMLDDLILTDVYSKMPEKFVERPIDWARRHEYLVTQLKPMERKTSATAPLLTQDVQQRKHNLRQAARQDSK